MELMMKIETRLFLSVSTHDEVLLNLRQLFFLLRYKPSRMEPWASIHHDVMSIG